jgi:hypothetical protein
MEEMPLAEELFRDENFSYWFLEHLSERAWEDAKAAYPPSDQVTPSGADGRRETMGEFVRERARECARRVMNQMAEDPAKKLC